MVTARAGVRRDPGFAISKVSGGAGSIFSIGKSKAKIHVQQETGVAFPDVAGIDEAKEELMTLAEFQRTPEHCPRLGGKIPKGALIVGTPGTGKPLLGKTVAGEADVPFFSISGSEFLGMFVSVSAARMRAMFAQAQQQAPCLVFIDKARGFASFGGHDEREQTLNQLLVEMDDFDTDKGVIIMAAANRPEILDPALLRAGRFDRHVAPGCPDPKGREYILALRGRNVKLVSEVDLVAPAARTSGEPGEQSPAAGGTRRQRVHHDERLRTDAGSHRQ